MAAAFRFGLDSRINPTCSRDAKLMPEYNPCGIFLCSTNFVHTYDFISLKLVAHRIKKKTRVILEEFVTILTM